MMNRRLLMSSAIAAAATAPLLPIAAAAQQPAESRLQQVLKRGFLVAGVTTTAPPFGYRDDKGEVVGFDIDMARLLAKTLFSDASKIKLETLAQDARWAAVQQGRVDVAMMATTVYPDRAQRVAFTRAYIDSGFAVLVQKGSRFQKIAELNDPQVKIASRPIPSQRDRLSRYFPKAQGLFFDSPADQILAVKAGRADALQSDLPIVKWYAATNDDLRSLGLFTGFANNAWFTQQGDFTWWLYLDTVVSEMLTGSLYDDYADIYRKWFREDPPPQRPYASR
ncbi:MAG: transporter substrate-binding domain-containing protein [Alphaproteobacteria bacterium]|nr:transporter substrate-binding domain-containing protein [Alphaproteobacteria bacterium]